jgi:hypothetical protein
MQSDQVIEEKIKAMINRHYKPPAGAKCRPCWSFCREIMALFSKQLPERPFEGMKRTDLNGVPMVLLLQLNAEWHSGILWPDCLHFIHAEPYFRPLTSNKDSDIQMDGWMVRKESISLWPWYKLLEGYYE